MTRTKAALLGMTGAMAIVAGSARAQDEQMVFGFVPASMVYPYNVAAAEGFTEAAEAAGARAVILDPQGEVQAQGNAIDDLIAQGVKGIGLLPLDSVVAESFVDSITEAGLPSAAMAVMVGDPTKQSVQDVYSNLNALIAPDDAVAGAQAAKLAMDLLKGVKGAKIAIVEGAAGTSSVPLRTKGFTDALDAAGFTYEVVGTQPTDWTPEEGEAVCQNFLTANPDIALIYSHADDMALGCARAIEAAGSQAFLVATSGGSALGNAAIAAGEIDGSVCVRPKQMGRMVFEALYAAATGANTEKAQFQTVELPIITQATLDGCPAEW